jgi:hypothetical protein
MTPEEWARQFAEDWGMTMEIMRDLESRFAAVVEEERQRNATPDLLAACERIVQEAQRDCLFEEEWSDGERLARAAILKARPEPRASTAREE